MKTSMRQCVIAIILLLLVGCNDAPQPTRISTKTPVLEVLSRTQTPSEKTPTSTTTQAPTMQLTLSTESAKELALQRLRDNSNCRLPCWWGINPNITTLQDARSILNPFSSLASTNSIDNDHGSMRLRIPNGEGLLYLVVEYDGIDAKVNTLIVTLSQLAKNKNGDYEQTFAEPAFAQATQSFQLTEILRSYGQPKQIMISTYSSQPLGWPVFFDIQLFYPDHGFLIAYESLMVSSTNGNVKGCPSKSNINIGLWEPGKYSSINDVPENMRNNISAFPLSSYLQIDEATKMSIQDFYETFKNDNGTLCLETPANLWPMPGQ
jgi:hypothetical protein